MTLTKSQEEYNLFVAVSKDKRTFEKSLKKRHQHNQKKIRRELATMERKLPNGHTAIAFLKWISNQSEHCFYISNVQLSGSIYLIKRPNLDVAINLCHCQPNPLMKSLIGYRFFLELKNISSTKKGEGTDMMKTLLALKHQLNVPISLWTEIDRNTAYFERFGFESVGKLGANGENLMILL